MDSVGWSRNRASKTHGSSAQLFFFPAPRGKHLRNHGPQFSVECRGAETHHGPELQNADCKARPSRDARPSSRKWNQYVKFTWQWASACRAPLSEASVAMNQNRETMNTTEPNVLVALHTILRAGSNSWYSFALLFCIYIKYVYILLQNSRLWAQNKPAKQNGLLTRYK